jgi:hypothetical protein
MQQSHGSSPCPISGEMFAWEMRPESSEAKMDIYGNITYEKGYAVENKQDG